jgi:hypothetical protein
MRRQATRLFAALCLLAFRSTLQAQEPANPDELRAIDLRPQIEKDGIGLSPLTGKCNKDVFRIADVASDPLKVEVLRANLARQLGLAGDGKTLMVLNWSIYYNKYSAPGGAKLGGIGIQGYSLPGAKEKKEKRGSKCSRQESAGGWYEDSEVTTTAPPLVSEFSGTFGGKPFNVRVVHSPRHKIEGKFEGGTDDTQELLDTVQETAEALATAIVQ